MRRGPILRRLRDRFFKASTMILDPDQTWVQLRKDFEKSEIIVLIISPFLSKQMVKKFLGFSAFTQVRKDPETLITYVNSVSCSILISTSRIGMYVADLWVAVSVLFGADRRIGEMITGLYSAASGMVVQMKNQDVLAHNLGNSLIPGFKRESMIVRSFPDVMLQQTYAGVPPSLERPRYGHAIGRIGTGAGVDWVYTDSSPGQIVHTGDQNDLAMVADGYFTILTPDGMRYTRNGSFYRDAEGYLTTPEGHYLAGQGSDGYIQPIKLSSDRFIADKYGNVYDLTTDPNTGVPVQNFVDQLRIVDFRNRDLLMKVGNNLYTLEPGNEDNIIPPRRLGVAQGYIERSNCVPTTEMIHLIDSMRNFEANSRVIRKIDQTLRRTVNDVGRVS